MEDLQTAWPGFVRSAWVMVGNCVSVEELILLCLSILFSVANCTIGIVPRPFRCRRHASVCRALSPSAQVITGPGNLTRLNS